MSVQRVIRPIRVSTLNRSYNDYRYFVKRCKLSLKKKQKLKKTFVLIQRKIVIINRKGLKGFGQWLDKRRDTSRRI